MNDNGRLYKMYTEPLYEEFADTIDITNLPIHIQFLFASPLDMKDDGINLKHSFIDYRQEIDNF